MTPKAPEAADGQKQTIHEDLKHLAIQAEMEGKWLYAIYHCIWLSPREAENYWAAGRFLWHKRNWKLVDPEIGRKELHQAVINAEKELDVFVERMKNGTKRTQTT